MAFQCFRPFPCVRRTSHAPSFRATGGACVHSLNGHQIVMWESMVANLATVALVVLGWNQAQSCLDRLTRAARRTLFAVAMGGGAVASMLLAVQLEPGVIFDLRSTLISLAGFFGGAPGALIAGGIAAVYRMLLGGPGVWAGLIGIGCAGGVGVLGHLLMRGRKPTFPHLLCFAACVSAATIAPFWTLPAEIRSAALQGFGVEISLLNFAAAGAAAVAVVHMLELAAERELLRAALAQAPDFQFIKNRRSEFVAVNQAVAGHNGFRKPGGMLGRTDFDITLPGRAQKLFDEEQEVLRTGVGIVNQEEQITAVNGATRWFSTSKSPLRNSDGEVIGLAGVTRDITGQKQGEASLASSRSQIRAALEEVSDGVALFSGEGWLIYANPRFRECIGLNGQPDAGLDASDVFASLKTAEPWTDKPFEFLLGGTELELQLADLRWLRIRSLPLRQGVMTVLVADVTREKEAGRMLDAFAASLHAMTEGLDGLPSPTARRSFNRDVQAALAQAGALQRTLTAS